ncbi:hypothetical protein ACA910_003253 [Epithemia clementina (nom. ined.)]
MAGLGAAPVQEEEETVDDDAECVGNEVQDEPANEEVDSSFDDDATEEWEGYQEDAAGPEEADEAEEQNKPDEDPALYIDVDEHMRKLGAALAPEIANFQEDLENDSVHDQDEEEIQFMEDEPTRAHGYNLRPNREPSFAYRFGFEEEAPEGANGVAFVQEATQICDAEEFEPQSMHTLLCKYLFTQMSAKRASENMDKQPSRH